jgi:hypothetical protein
MKGGTSATRDSPRDDGAWSGHPWHGYGLGGWSCELERQADKALPAECFVLGSELSRIRRGDVWMNTPIDRSEGHAAGSGT